MWIRDVFRALVLLALSLGASAQISETITYQGYLEDGGQPANGQYDFEFVQIASVGGSQSDPIELDNVQVTDGVFSVDLGFSNSFNLQDYELRISVRPGASSGAYTLLAPNTPIRAAPLAITASFSGYAAAVPNNTITNGNLQNGSVSSAKMAAGAVGATQIDSTQVQRRVTGACAPGSSVQSISDTGGVTCESDDVGGSGDITAIAAGTGLSGGGTSGDVALSIANGGVGSAQINTAQVQARVSGSCTQGIASVDSAGVPTCVGNGSAITNVTFLTESGLTDLAMAVRSDGNALIVGYLSGSGDLVAYACQDRGCVARTRTVIDASANDVGSDADVVVVGGRAYVGYYDATAGDLKIAACSDETCVSSTILVADSGGNVGQFVKAVTDGFPRPAFVYYDATNGDLKVAGCGANCGSVTVTTIDNSANDVGRGIAAVYFNSFLHVAYQDATAAQIKVATCLFSSNCQVAPILINGAATVAGEIPIAAVVLAEGRFGYFFRSASGLSIQYCLSWRECTSLSAANVVSPLTPHAVDASRDGLGFPVVAMTLTSNFSTYFRCRSDHCGESVVSSTSASIQAQPAVIRGPDGMPRTAMPSSTGLVFRACSNEFCTGSGAVP
ncbi:MAG TPA: hypothetical protein PLB00_09700 [Pseudomonadota bacterium]|jgi:hypothetical protein|nr:hypothetical protein [Pseudomonadota bacterium]